jgi:hypothetical protein
LAFVAGFCPRQPLAGSWIEPPKSIAAMRLRVFAADSSLVLDFSAAPQGVGYAHLRLGLILSLKAEIASFTINQDRDA